MLQTTCTDQTLLDDWHVVAYARELTPGTLLPTRLLGRDLVAWRDAEGQAHVWEDLCIHRGARLSKGWITENTVVCPYHGWRYNGSGACVLIPSAPGLPIPPQSPQLPGQSHRAGRPDLGLPRHPRAPSARLPRTQHPRLPHLPRRPLQIPGERLPRRRELHRHHPFPLRPRRLQRRPRQPRHHPGLRRHPIKRRPHIQRNHCLPTRRRFSPHSRLRRLHLQHLPPSGGLLL